MSTARPREILPGAVVPLVLCVLILSFGYAVLIADVFAWLFAVGALAAFVLSMYVVYLFYRLVRAVERIADETAR